MSSKSPEKQLSQFFGIILIILTVLLFGFFVYVFIIEGLTTEHNQCLAERLCWDNQLEFSSMGIQEDDVYCYNSTKQGNILYAFVKVNWTELDKIYVCNGK